MSIQQAVSPSAYVSLIKGRTNWTVIHHFFNDTDTLFWLRPVQYYLCSTKTGIADKSVNTVAKGKAPVHNRFNIFFINLMLISFWVKNRRSFLNALRWKGILFSKSPSNSIFNCLCYHTPHSFPQSFSWFQSTLPRGERQEWWRARPMTEDISIHAPTRGATIHFLLNTQDSMISIHAPTRGATILIRAYIRAIQISIHAPTRGATVKVSQKSLFYIISIHAPTRGATATLTNFFFYNQSIFC